ncbi:hypothetical protein K1T35_48025 (plasmid) [Pseudonocardia sp. DSM 110487]|uniref:hypothetical protein n=1 Tax=Pseudonocardia sp. DSM 110487 TaxID=2865833 RepID=UPI001C69F132|nr:hypothetical protein [Pseudonocardia sp. DSM 110487]QYN41099.1 hypothetical protein K1T35_48025 [Pseudonocardia sp. DSM 110487]
MITDDRAILATACSIAGIDRSSAALRRHATSVYLLPSSDIVARVNRGIDRRGAATAIAVTRWLCVGGPPRLSSRQQSINRSSSPSPTTAPPQSPDPSARITPTLVPQSPLALRR